MATDAIVMLEQLRCISLKNVEAKTEPYIWPALIQVDDHTLTTPDLVKLVAPVLGNARVVIKDSMRAGDVAAIPTPVGVLRARFEDGLATRALIVVVALLEMDETPESAMKAGYQAYRNELRAAVAENLFALSGADEAERERITGLITERVAKKVRSAVEDGLSWFEKAQVLAGTLDLDDPMGSDTQSFQGDALVSTPISLAFERTVPIPIIGGEVSSHYEILGRLQLRPVTVDRCQAQVNAVIEAQGVVNGIQAEIKELQAMLRGEVESDLPKPFIIAEIKRIRTEELPPAVAELERARKALAACRSHPGADHDNGGVLQP